MKKEILLIGIFVVGIFVGCSHKNQQAVEENNEIFSVTTPIITDTTVIQEYVADIQAIQNVEIRARMNGFIEKIHVDEGQKVQAGQLLFTISSEHYKEELRKAEAQLKSVIAEANVAEVELKNTKILVEKNAANSQLKTAIADTKVAEIELKNTRNLVEKKIVSASELEMAEARLEATQAKVKEAEASISIVSNTELEMAKAKLAATQAKIAEAQSEIEYAKHNLSFTLVKAPFNGVINRIPLKVGSVVEEGTFLTTISNGTEVFAYFNVSEKEYLDFIKEKDMQQGEISLLLANGQAFPYKGKIEMVESEIDKNTGSIAFRARFNNSELLLKHGASAKIQLLKQVQNAMLIPQKSTFEVQENTYVYVVDKDSIVQARSVGIQQRLPHLYVIDSGLSETDYFLFEGIQRVKEGDKISTEEKSLSILMKDLITR